jgi:hypothetical protein
MAVTSGGRGRPPEEYSQLVARQTMPTCVVYFRRRGGFVKRSTLSLRALEAFGELL